MSTRRDLRQWRGWLYVAPALLFVAVFVVIPFGQLIAMSMTDRSLLGGGKFIGLGNYVRIWNDSGFLARAPVHGQIHDRSDPDPDDPRLRAGPVDGGQHAAQAAHPHHRFLARGHRALEFEPALVLAVRRAGRPLQQAPGRLARHRPADRLVRQRRSRLLGGRDLHHLEGGRLRHGAVHRRNPVDRSGDPGGGGRSTAPATGDAPFSSSFP